MTGPTCPAGVQGALGTIPSPVGVWGRTGEPGRDLPVIGSFVWCWKCCSVDLSVDGVAKKVNCLKCGETLVEIGSACCPEGTFLVWQEETAV